MRLLHEDPETHFHLGMALYELGEHVSARGLFHCVTHLEPQNPGGYFNLALAEAALGNYVEAHLQCARLKELDPALADELAQELSRRRDD